MVLGPGKTGAALPVYIYKHLAHSAAVSAYGLRNVVILSPGRVGVEELVDVIRNVL